MEGCGPGHRGHGRAKARMKVLCIDPQGAPKWPAQVPGPVKSWLVVFLLWDHGQTYPPGLHSPHLLNGDSSRCLIHKVIGGNK